MAAVAVGAGRGGTVLDLGAMSSRALGALAEFAAGVATASAAVAVAVGTGLAFTPVNGPTGRWVRVAGPGNVSYFRSPTERLLALRYTTADGVQHRWSTLPDPDGNYRGPDGKVIARVVKTGAKVGTLVSTAALLGTDSDKGRICPVPQKDRGGPRGQEYENYMKAWLNPDNPTPSGLAYGFRRPGAVDPTLIDDCQQKTGALAEYKGPNYAEHMLKNDGCWRHGMLRKMLEQADRQEAARQGRSLTWYFAEKSVADFMRREFQATHLDINVVWFPMPEGRK